MTSIATRWRNKKYLKEIEEGNIEAIEKLLRQELRRNKSIKDILTKIKLKNKELLIKFLEDFKKEVVKAKLLGKDISVVDRFYAKPLYKYLLEKGEIDLQAIKNQLKEELQNEIGKFTKRFYLRKREEAIAVFGEKLLLAEALQLKLDLFNKEGRVYYFSEVSKEKLKEVKKSLKGVLSEVREEILGELLLSSHYLDEPEFISLKSWVIEQLDKLKEEILNLKN